jgi:hypothetical protein
MIPYSDGPFMIEGAIPVSPRFQPLRFSVSTLWGHRFHFMAPKFLLMGSTTTSPFEVLFVAQGARIFRKCDFASSIQHFPLVDVLVMSANEDVVELPVHSN